MLVSATDLAARTTSLRSPDFDQANPQKRNCISTDGSTTSEHASKTISLEKKTHLRNLITSWQFCASWRDVFGDLPLTKPVDRKVIGGACIDVNTTTGHETKTVSHTSLSLHKRRAQESYWVSIDTTFSFATCSVGRRELAASLSINIACRSI